MQNFYVITSLDVSSVEDLCLENMNRRKVNECTWAVQIWLIERKAFDFTENHLRNAKPFRVQKAILLTIMKREKIGTKVEVDPESL